MYAPHLPLFVLPKVSFSSMSRFLTQHLPNMLIPQKAHPLLRKHRVLRRHPPSQTLLQLRAQIQGTQLILFLLCGYIPLLRELFIVEFFEVFRYLFDFGHAAGGGDVEVARGVFGVGAGGFEDVDCGEGW